jgi:simple sugar transport system permease protein
VAEIGIWAVPLGVVAGALRVSTPFLFVSLGETITEKSGRINLGQEGTLVMGAMAGYGISYLSSQWLVNSPLVVLAPWLGLAAAGGCGVVLGSLHAWLCSKPRVNDVAVGIALMLFGTGLAFYLGKPFIRPRAPQLPSIPLGFWSNVPQIRSSFNISILFFIGAALAPITLWALNNTRWGLRLRTVGESADAARAMGYSISRVRMGATALGGFLAGIGGAFLSLSYPGVWNEGLSSGQGLMAVALVIFARWNPVNCLWAALLFGGASALGPALQSVGVTSGYYLYSAAPYVLTLLIMIITCSPSRTLAGVPGELSMTTS